MKADTELHLTEARVSDYADGVLDAATRADVERHLASCPDCRDAVRETRAVVALAQRSRLDVSAPAELWPLVASSTIHLATVRRQVLASMRGVLMLVAIALVAATAVITWNVARWTSAPRTMTPTVRTSPQAPRPPSAPSAPRP